LMIIYRVVYTIICPVTIMKIKAPLVSPATWPLYSQFSPYCHI